MNLIKTITSIAAVVGLIAILTGRPYQTEDSSKQVSQDMQEAAEALLSTLSDEQRKTAQYPFDSDERQGWNFIPIPGKRKGMKIKDMSASQRTATHRLLQSVLSAQGYLKATSIQQLEQVLGVLEDNPVYRDPEQYFVTIFGKPASGEPWGWRFEGHHMSLNFSSVDMGIAVTPVFWGSNPAQVPEGPFTGWRVLHEEIDIARSLMRTFTEEQLPQVVISDEAPRDIITGNSREAKLEEKEGLAYMQMTAIQRRLLWSLLEVYAHNLKSEIADTQLEKIKANGIDSLRFAWAGSQDPDSAHYYRIHGPTTLIEYDNTQNNANHIHTVWRDLTDDFGRDLLRMHYDHTAPDHGH